MKILSCSDLKQMLEDQQDFMLLNVLSETSFRKAHIPNSQNIPVSEAGFVERVENVLRGKDKDYPIVTYCAGIHCNASKDAANLLIEADHTNVSAFEGGMEEWLEAGYPASCDDAASCEEHCSSE